ncbi:DUF3667 domain-containing protein [Massilia sp. 9I]|uniref:DUF3667 domain-containing protein n=1 Tax=Massilia sp. 9I TaxID=2653152 RepID=UPI0012F062C3|nr:DUF3667 domain-containing protein [Massilia sp. 9I]VXC43601.1 conserved membrane hypothetical protein [Massilia sp. 9I]
MTTDAIEHRQHTSSCKNCDATTSGNYCHQCGQATHLHVPSAREFLHEFLSHYVAIEGKLWRSLKLLVTKPGLLTREYIEGRRVRYVEPLRLYLSFSIIFFALIKLSGVEIADFGAGDSPQARPPVSAPGATSPLYDDDEMASFKEFKTGAIAQARGVDPRLGHGVETFFDRPPEERRQAVKRAFFSYTPYAIFFMMPVFAMYLKLLYLGSGRRYGEHFLFALHSNAFAFLMLSLFMLTPPSWDFVRFVFLTWLTFYLPTAMRRVYGGSRKITALRWIALMTLHLLSMTLAVSAVFGVALMT